MEKLKIYQIETQWLKEKLNLLIIIGPIFFSGTSILINVVSRLILEIMSQEFEKNWCYITMMIYYDLF